MKTDMIMQLEMSRVMIILQNNMFGDVLTPNTTQICVWYGHISEVTGFQVKETLVSRYN